MDSRVATGLVDILFLMLMVFVLLPHNPSKSEKDSVPVGDLTVEVMWESGSDHDVDLWVKSPDDRAVGYTRTRGKHFSLFRDVIGASASFDHRVEIAATRSIPNGEYIVNVHMFNNYKEPLPMNVDIRIRYRPKGDRREVIYEGKVELEKRKQELTVVRFSMNDGKFVDGSIHYTQENLRNVDTGPGH